MLSHWMPWAGDHLNGRPPLLPEISSESFMPFTSMFSSAGISWIVALARGAELTARSIVLVAAVTGVVEVASLQATRHTASTSGAVRTSNDGMAHSRGWMPRRERKSHAVWAVGDRFACKKRGGRKRDVAKRIGRPAAVGSMSGTSRRVSAPSDSDDIR